VGRNRESLDLRRDLWRDARRADLVGGAGGVLGLIVEEPAVLGDDLDHGEGHGGAIGLLENWAGQLEPLEILLDEQLIVVAERLIDCGGELAGREAEPNAETGPLRRRLDDARDAGVVECRLQRGGALLGRLPARDLPRPGQRQSRLQEDAARQTLVHGQSAGENAGARVGEAQHLQHPLNGPVLPIGPVHGDEHHVHGRAAVFTKAGGRIVTLEGRAPIHTVERRGRGDRQGESVGRQIADGHQPAPLAGDAYRLDVVPIAVKRVDDNGARVKGHLVLRCGSAHEDGHVGLGLHEGPAPYGLQSVPARTSPARGILPVPHAGPIAGRRTRRFG